MTSISRIWLSLVYQNRPWLLPLYPLGWIFRFGVFCRRLAYRCGVIKQEQFSCPVIVVGNLSIGGTGKTPVVIWLANFLKNNGFKPGIVSKGFKGSEKGPKSVLRSDTSDTVGDEPLMMAHQVFCPVVISKKRAAGIEMLQNQFDIDIVLMDDGLQHLKVARDYEIVVVDAARGFGNGQCLPVGPLREPATRQQHADWVLWQGEASPDRQGFELSFNRCYNIARPMEVKALEAFSKTVHAVAGIGNPERFFSALKAQGLDIIEHPFDDHHPFTADDFEGFAHEIIIMTEKDAIKCKHFDLFDAWAINVVPTGLDTFGQELLTKLRNENNGWKTP